MWPVAPIVIEKDPVSGERVVIHRFDPIFVAVIWLLPILAVAIAVLAILIPFAGPKVMPALIELLIVEVLLALSLTMFTRVPADTLGDRMFIGGVRFFTNCLVFNPPFSTLVTYSGSQRIVETEKKGGKYVLTVQLKQGTNPDTVGNSDKQIVQLTLVFYLNIWESPVGVNRAFRQEFSSNGNDAYTTKVEPEVLKIIVAHADAPLQKFEMEEVLTNVDAVQPKVQEVLEERLRPIGVKIHSLAIGDVDDVIENNGFVALRSMANRKENTSKAVQRGAIARKEALLVQAEARLESATRHIEVETDIAGQKLGLIKKQLLVQQENAKIGIADLVARTRFLKARGSWVGVLVNALERVPDDRVVEVANAAAEGLKSIGLRPEGSLLLANSGDPEGGMNMAKVATGLGLATSLLKDLNLLPPNFQVPPAEKEKEPEGTAKT